MTSLSSPLRRCLDRRSLDPGESHQIRRVPVVDGEGCCVGIISQADIVAIEPPNITAALLYEVSRDTGNPSR